MEPTCPYSSGHSSHQSAMRGHIHWARARCHVQPSNQQNRVSRFAQNSQRCVLGSYALSMLLTSCLASGFLSVPRCLTKSYGIVKSVAASSKEPSSCAWLDLHSCRPSPPDTGLTITSNLGKEVPSELNCGHMSAFLFAKSRAGCNLSVRE